MYNFVYDNFLTIVISSDLKGFNESVQRQFTRGLGLRLSYPNRLTELNPSL